MSLGMAIVASLLPPSSSITFITPIRGLKAQQQAAGFETHPPGGPGAPNQPVFGFCPCQPSRWCLPAPRVPPAAAGRCKSPPLGCLRNCQI